MIFPVLAGLGALAMMSNPRRKRRAKRRNPKGDILDVALDVARLRGLGGYTATLMDPKVRARARRIFQRHFRSGSFGKHGASGSSKHPVSAETARSAAAFAVAEALLGGGSRTEDTVTRMAETLKKMIAEVKSNPRVSKTKKVYVLQGNYGYGWDDLLEEDTYREAKAQAKVYRENERNASHRVITRRVPIEAANPRRRRAKRRK